jgi:hypothetical protein
LACPDPTPGTLSDWSGILAGSPFDPADCYSGPKAGLAYNWQCPVVVSSHGPGPEGTYGGAGARYQHNQRVKGERWLLLGFAAGDLAFVDAPYPPCSPEAPFRLYHDIARYEPAGGTVGYKVVINRVNHSATNCNASQKVASSSSWVEFTEISDAQLAGRVDVTINGEHLIGTFVAPQVPMSGCTRPTGTPTCLNP